MSEETKPVGVFSRAAVPDNDVRRWPAADVLPETISIRHESYRHRGPPGKRSRILVAGRRRQE